MKNIQWQDINLSKPPISSNELDAINGFSDPCLVWCIYPMGIGVSKKSMYDHNTGQWLLLDNHCDVSHYAVINEPIVY